MVNYEGLLPILSDYKLTSIGRPKKAHKNQENLTDKYKSDKSPISSSSSHSSSSSSSNSSYNSTSTSTTVSSSRIITPCTSKEETKLNLEQERNKNVTNSTLGNRCNIERTGDCILFLDLSKRVAVSNSSLVKRKVSVAKDTLAVASLTAGASLPLMVGTQHENTNISGPNHNSSSMGPTNTALRAEQRLQNVVKPQIKTSPPPAQILDNQRGFKEYNKYSTKLEDSDIWPDQIKNKHSDSSVVDEWMKLHDRLNYKNYQPSLFEDSSSKARDKSIHLHGSRYGSDWMATQDDEQITNMNRQQELIRWRREKTEFDKHVRKQHLFFISMIEDRRRNLEIILTTWSQRDFKRAVEKLVDIYNQGLVFAAPTEDKHQQRLSSLNTSLVVDIIGVMIFKPNLWTLDISQLLLPIIVNDLLVHDKIDTYEYYAEVGVKALKLILVHFSSVIANTLESQKEEARLVGVDLSREDRISKCKSLTKSLLEARDITAKRKCDASLSMRLSSLFQELDQNFIYLFKNKRINGS